MNSKQKITLVTLDEHEKNVHQPIFAVVEQVFEDMQDYDMPNWDVKADGYSQKHAYNISLHYYESASPIDDTSIPGTIEFPGNAKFEPSTMENVALGNQGQQLLVMPDEGEAKNSLVKVLPKRHCSQFVKYWAGTDDSLPEFILGDNRLCKQLRDITLKHLGFDLTLYAEHIGNAYEINSNPIFRNLTLRGEFNTIGRYGVHLNFTFREDGEQNLTARLLNYHHNDILAEESEITFTNKSTKQFIPLVTEQNLLELFIYDDSKKLIYHLKDIVFLRGFQVNMNVASKEVNTHLRRKGKTLKCRHTKFINENFGVRNERTGDTRMFALPLSSQIKSNTIFVDGNPDKREENKAIIRKAIGQILSKARRDCIICDPYFTASDFVDFVLPMPQLYVNLKILNSRESLTPDEADKGSRLSNLAKVIKDYNAKVGGQPVMCNTITQVSVHDRFVVVDNRVWLLGASLSEIGKRATTIVEIPADKAKEIRDSILNWWYNYSKPIDTDDRD